jgi:hypothetical protein
VLDSNGNFLNYICPPYNRDGSLSAGITKTFDGGFALAATFELAPNNSYHDAMVFKYRDSLQFQSIKGLAVGNGIPDESYGVIQLLDSTLSIIGRTKAPLNGYPYATNTNFAPLYYNVSLNTPHYYNTTSIRVPTGAVGGVGKEIKQLDDSTLVYVGTYEMNSFNTAYTLSKMNLLGTNATHRYYGGADTDVGNSFVITPNKEFILAGYTDSNDSLRPNHSVHPDGWVFRVNSAGQMLWSKCYGSTGYDFLYKIIQSVQDPEHYYLLGEYQHPENLDVDAWVIKIDGHTGDILWQEFWGGSDTDAFLSGTIDNSGSLVVVGVSASTNGHLTSNAGALDTWIVKFRDLTVSTQEVVQNTFDVKATSETTYQITTTITLTDALGKNIANYTITSAELNIDLTKYQQGIYFISATGYKSVKLVR